MKLYLVRHHEESNIYVITSVFTHGPNEREEAKRGAHTWIGGDPDRYVVSPLTEHGSRVRLNITVDI